MGRNSSHGEGEERYRCSAVGNGKSPGKAAVAVHGYLERDHPCCSFRQGHLDNQNHDTHSAHSFQRCAGDQTSKRCCVGQKRRNNPAAS